MRLEMRDRDEAYIGTILFGTPKSGFQRSPRAWFVRNKIETCNISASRTMATGPVKNFIKYSDAELGV